MLWIEPFGSVLGKTGWFGLVVGRRQLFENAFPEDVGDILFGNVPKDDVFSLLSPDNTSDGWLRKKWKIIEGKRCLIKGDSGATRQEPYNEVLASEIMRQLGIPHVPYTLTVVDEYPYSVCESFITADTELVSAWHITQTRKREDSVSHYRHFLDCCEVTVHRRPLRTRHGRRIRACPSGRLAGAPVNSDFTCMRARGTKENSVKVHTNLVALPEGVNCNVARRRE